MSKEEYKAMQRAMGICTRCGRGVEPERRGMALCYGCTATARLAMRERTNSKPWRPGGPGRKPLEAKP